MRSKDIILADIDLANQAINEAKKQEAEIEKELSKAKNLRDEMIHNNPIATERKKLEDKKEKLKTWGFRLIVAPFIIDAVLFVLLLTFEGVIAKAINDDPLKIELIILGIPPILIIFGIILFIISLFTSIKIKALSSRLADFDVEKAPIEYEISQYESDLSDCLDIINKKDSDLETYKTELKYIVYEKNYVLIFVAQEGSSSNEFRIIKHNITIDNIEYGAAGLPFKAIALSEGIHAVRVDVGVYINESLHVYSSNVEQVQVSNGSIFMKFVFKGPSMPFVAQKYYDAPAFFEATNQKP